MKKVYVPAVALMLCSFVLAQDKGTNDSKDYLKKAAKAEQENSSESSSPWLGKYCMSLFAKTRTARTIGKDNWSLCLKMQHFDWDRKRGSDNSYHELPWGQQKERLNTVVVTKYGWAEDHHLALGVPTIFNDFDLGANSNDSKGLGNIYLFEKWNFLKETEHMPAVAVDFWYYLPTGDTDRKLGSSDGAYKVTTEVSKAWKDFSLHFNPGYTWSETKNANISEVNAGLILTPCQKIWPALEYNYCYKENAGHRHDLVPGVIWKLAKKATFKIGFPINIDSTETYRDRAGIIAKFFYRF